MGWINFLLQSHPQSCLLFTNRWVSEGSKTGNTMRKSACEFIPVSPAHLRDSGAEAIPWMFHAKLAQIDLMPWQVLWGFHQCLLFTHTEEGFPRSGPVHTQIQKQKSHAPGIQPRTQQIIQRGVEDSPSYCCLPITPEWSCWFLTTEKNIKRQLNEY